VQSLTKTLGVQLSVLEKGPVFPQRTNNLDAYDYYLRGVEQWYALTPNAFASSREMLEKAIALDSGYADSYAMLSLVCLMESIFQWDTDPHGVDRAEELARKAVLLDDSNASAYAIRGWIASLRNRPDQAVTDGKRAITLDPNFSFAYIALSETLNGLEKPKEALAYAQKAMRLDPKHPELYSLDVGVAYNQMGSYREALDALKAGPANNPWIHANLIYAYTELGRERDARAEAVKVLRVAPKFSVEVATMKTPDYWDTPFGRHFLDDMHRAGLK
jgi:tetratricopeptide (TPR) repeat protein